MLNCEKLRDWFRNGSFILDFSSGVLPACSFSRASVGHYYNSSGLIQSANNNIARFDYDPMSLVLKGILIEPSVSSLVLSSSDFTTFWNTTACSILTNTQTSPDGSQDCQTLHEDATDSVHRVFGNVSLTSGNTYTFSYYAKPAGQTWAYIECGETSGGGPYHTAYFNLSGSGTMGNVSGIISSAIQQLPNGWYRISIEFLASTTSTGELVIGAAASNGFQFYQGTDIDSLYIYGSQFESSPYASSFILCAGSGVTRAADALSFTIPAKVGSLVIGHLVFTFDDNSTQTIAVSSGAYTVPTNLNRRWIKRIQGVA